jgi:hypothetical protein
MSWTPLEAVLMLLIALSLANNARLHYAAGITKAMGLLLFMVPKNRYKRVFAAVSKASSLAPIDERACRRLVCVSQLQSLCFVVFYV